MHMNGKYMHTTVHIVKSNKFYKRRVTGTLSNSLRNKVANM